MKIKTWMAALGLVVCLVAQPAIAGQFEDANAAYDRGDYATAFQLLRPLAEQGDAYAQTVLGSMYYYGEGVLQDYAEAATWYGKAAKQGVAMVQFNLGTLYAEGKGVPQDYAEALKWYRLAADQGNAHAQLNLGYMYAKGQGVPQDFVRAHMWYSLSAISFPASKTVDRDRVIRNPDIIAKLMTSDQIAEAQRLAREWLAAHHKQ